MKLHNYTLLYISVALFFIISIWAAIFYVEMLDEVYDSIDDNLKNHKLLIVQKAAQDSTILEKVHFDESNYSIHKITSGPTHKIKDVYKDTLMYMQHEDDLEPVRLLKTVFTLNKHDYYELRIISSTVEEDDLIEDLFYSLVWLYAVLLISVFLVNTFLLKKIWRPFYQLIHQLEHFSLSSTAYVPVKTNVDEFKLLNTTVDSLLKKNAELFISQKQFIENAAHELQTPLAISINKLELLTEKNNLTEAELYTLASVIENLQRLTRLNKSLLLLSKIENKQFYQEAIVSLSSICRRLHDDLSDLATYKNVAVEFENAGELTVKMNKDLADMLLSNLVKNAVTHTPAGGLVHIRCDKQTLIIENSGTKALDPQQIFKRFYKNSGETHSTGLGLAIVKAITDKYGFALSYSFDGKHVFRIRF
ncbi:MAG: sensor histidine kinase [Cytophaga sp.]|uniref:sensor histidine kinase n=1 Tax=Cytophaga sp. TaxID=29535 RepID=UPI003F822B04